MKLKIILPFLFYFMCFAQDHIHFVMIGESTVIQEIEIEIIHNLVSIYNGKNKDKITYQIDTVNYFHKMFDVIRRESNTSKKHLIVAISSISNTEKRRKEFTFSTTYIPSKDVIFTLKTNNN